MVDLSGIETVRFEADATGIAHAVLARPEKHNAMNAQMIRDLSTIARHCHENRDIRAVILSGDGESFCAGGDLNWMKEQSALNRAGKIGGAKELADMLRDMDQIPQVLIGAINGNTFGGGVGLVSVCDLAVAGKSTQFGLTETRLGLIPATISPFVIAKIGAAAARARFLTAERFGSEDALRIGLISSISDDTASSAERHAKAALACAPGAVDRAKALIRGVVADGQGAGPYTIEALADRWESAEAREGIAAFLEKRPVPWRPKE